MEGDLTTPAAHGVGLVAPLSKGACSLGHGDYLASQIQAAMKLVWWTRGKVHDKTSTSTNLELRLLEEPPVLAGLVPLLELGADHVASLLFLHGILGKNS